MATKNFRSTVLEPTSEFARGDKLRFTALATVSEVLKGSFSETTIGEDGVYSVDLQYGKHRIDYKPYEGVWRHFADVEVNADTLATTLQDLALASVPVTDDAVLALQGILADAEAAKEAAESAETAAETALASIDATIDDAKAGYPDAVKAMFHKKIYVDSDPAVGSDDNIGSSSSPMLTIEAAINSTPAGSFIELFLAAGKTHTLSNDVYLYNKHVALLRYGDSAAANPILKQGQMSNLLGFYRAAKFLMYSSSFRSSSVDIHTATLSGSADGFQNYYVCLFSPQTCSASVIISRCSVVLNNCPLLHQHPSGSHTFATSYALASVDVSLASVSNDKQQVLMSSYLSAIPVSFLLNITELSIPSGVNMKDLFDVNLTKASSNVEIV